MRLPLLFLILPLSVFASLANKEAIDEALTSNAGNHEGATLTLDSILAAGQLSSSDSIHWYSSAGKLMLDGARYQEAFGLFQKGMDLASLSGSDSSMAILSQRLGTVNYRIDRKDKAIPQLQFADSIGRALDLHLVFYACEVNLGAIYTELKQYDLAEAYLSGVLNAMENHGDAPANYTPMAQRILATMYRESGQPEKAQDLFAEIVEKARQAGDDYRLASVLLYYALVVIDNGQPEEALRMVEEAQVIMEKRGATAHDNVTLYDALATTLMAVGRHEEANEALRLSKNYEKEVFSTQMKDAVSEVEVKYETGRIKREKQLAEEQARTSALTLEVERGKNNQLIAGIATLIALTLLALLVFYIRAQRQKTLREAAMQRGRLTAVIEGEERERERLAMELHDGIGQMLSALKMNLQAAAFSDAPSSDLLNRTLTEVRRISHALLPTELSAGGLIPALQQIANELNHSGTLHVTLHASPLSRPLSADVEKNLFRMAQEVISNALKHAEASTLELSIFEEGKSLVFIIADDGKGMPANAVETSKGIGWKNTLARLELLHGSMEINNKASTSQAAKKGTTIRFTIPLG